MLSSSKSNPSTEHNTLDDDDNNETYGTLDTFRDSPVDASMAVDVTLATRAPEPFNPSPSFTNAFFTGPTAVAWSTRSAAILSQLPSHRPDGSSSTTVLLGTVDPKAMFFYDGERRFRCVCTCKHLVVY